MNTKGRFVEKIRMVYLNMTEIFNFSTIEENNELWILKLKRKGNRRQSTIDARCYN